MKFQESLPRRLMSYLFHGVKYTPDHVDLPRLTVVYILRKDTE